MKYYLRALLTALAFLTIAAKGYCCNVVDSRVEYEFVEPVVRNILDSGVEVNIFESGGGQRSTSYLIEFAESKHQINAISTNDIKANEARFGAAKSVGSHETDGFVSATRLKSQLDAEFRNVDRQNSVMVGSTSRTMKNQGFSYIGTKFVDRSGTTQTLIFQLTYRYPTTSPQYEHLGKATLTLVDLLIKHQKGNLPVEHLTREFIESKRSVFMEIETVSLENIPLSPRIPTKKFSPDRQEILAQSKDSHDRLARELNLLGDIRGKFLEYGPGHRTASLLLDAPFSGSVYSSEYSMRTPNRIKNENLSQLLEGEYQSVLSHSPRRKFVLYRNSPEGLGRNLVQFVFYGQRQLNSQPVKIEFTVNTSTTPLSPYEIGVRLLHKALTTTSEVNREELLAIPQ